MDDFPSGYFSTPDGQSVGLRIIAQSTGTGDRRGDLLLTEVRTVIDQLDARRFNGHIRVGLAGDIPNAAAEKQSLVTQAAWASALVLLVILAGVVFFYRSLWSLAIIALPALLGVGFA